MKRMMPMMMMMMVMQSPFEFIWFLTRPYAFHIRAKHVYANGALRHASVHDWSLICFWELVDNVHMCPYRVHAPRVPRHVPGRRISVYANGAFFLYPSPPS